MDPSRRTLLTQPTAAVMGAPPASRFEARDKPT